jgi:hypothetical protein
MWSATWTVSLGRGPRHSRDLSGARRPELPHQILSYERGFRRRMIDRFAADSITLSRWQGIRLPGVSTDAWHFARQPVLITLPPGSLHIRYISFDAPSVLAKTALAPGPARPTMPPRGRSASSKTRFLKEGFWKTSFTIPHRAFLDSWWLTILYANHE